jgi:hypothetical protein
MRPSSSTAVSPPAPALALASESYPAIVAPDVPGVIAASPDADRVDSLPPLIRSDIIAGPVRSSSDSFNGGRNTSSSGPNVNAFCSIRRVFALRLENTAHTTMAMSNSRIPMTVPAMAPGLFLNERLFSLVMLFGTRVAEGMTVTTVAVVLIPTDVDVKVCHMVEVW